VVLSSLQRNELVMSERAPRIRFRFLAQEGQTALIRRVAGLFASASAVALNGAEELSPAPFGTSPW